MEIFLKQSLLLRMVHLFGLVVVCFLMFTPLTFAQVDLPDGTPEAPMIDSSTFADPQRWYNDPKGSFTWEVTDGITSIAAEIALSSDHEPQIVLQPSISEFSVSEDDLEEGVNYFQLQFKNEEGWGEIASREVRIDTVPPPYVEFVVEDPETDGNFPLLLFAADDATSGIDGYEIQVADRDPVFKTAKQARFGYPLRDLEDGQYPVKVTAYDKAGNHSAVAGVVEVRAGWIDPAKAAARGSGEIEFTFVHWLIVFLAMMLAGQLVYILRTHKEHKEAEARLRHEAMEVRVQMEKIFTALRDEIFDQVSTISKRSRLTKREKETVETLSQALEVSETLIEKEIKDVQKLVKK